MVGAVIYVTMDRFLLHRPTVSTSSLQKFGLRGPAPMSRSEWTAAESERDGKNAPLLGGEGAGGEEQEGGGSPSRERRPSINAEDPEVAANDPKTHAAKERNFAMVRANTSLSSKKSEHQRLLGARRCCGRRRGSTRCRSAS